MRNFRLGAKSDIPSGRIPKGVLFECFPIYHLNIRQLAAYGNVPGYFHYIISKLPEKFPEIIGRQFFAPALRLKIVFRKPPNRLYFFCIPQKWREQINCYQKIGQS